jgi:hypothetical protein
MYDKLKIGGYVVVDDWFGFPARCACEDFFTVHGLSVYQGNDVSMFSSYDVVIVAIDTLSVYFEKKKDITIQYWRYKQRKFSGQ